MEQRVPRAHDFSSKKSFCFSVPPEKFALLSFDLRGGLWFDYGGDMYRKLQHDRSFYLDRWTTGTRDVGFRFLARAGEHPVRDAWGYRNECTDAEADKILLAFMHIASLVDHVHDHRRKKVCAQGCSRFDRFDFGQFVNHDPSIQSITRTHVDVYIERERCAYIYIYVHLHMYMCT